MELADNWEAFQTLKAKRLVDNFGLFRGVQVPDHLTDDDIDDEFILLLYRFIKGSDLILSAKEIQPKLWKF